MLTLIICSLLLTAPLYIECLYASDYNYHPEADGWLKLHKVPATWQQAFLQCHHEGAVLASPLTKELRNAMQSTIEDNDESLSYYIGANSKINPGQYVSIEGVPLANMPTADMYKLLDPIEGECLSTNGLRINVVSCSKRLPYLCYTKQDGRNLTECGTFDRGYHLEASTGSCYKVHTEFRTWLNASSICISEGGYLAIVNDHKEASMIRTKMPDTPVEWTGSKEWEPIYIGLHDWTGHGTWLTNHGDDIDKVFNAWAPDQPSSESEIENTQRCAGIIRTGKLDNIWCKTNTSMFICEKDPKNIRYKR